MKFNRVDLVARIEKRIADAVKHVLNQKRSECATWRESLVRWQDDGGDRDKLRSALAKLLDRDYDDQPITYADVSDLTRYTFRGGTQPMLPNLDDVQTSRALATLLNFLRSRDDETVSTYALEQVGLASALRELSDPHARVAWFDNSARRASARR